MNRRLRVAGWFIGVSGILSNGHKMARIAELDFDILVVVFIHTLSTQSAIICPPAQQSPLYP